MFYSVLFFTFKKYGPRINVLIIITTFSCGQAKKMNLSLHFNKNVDWW